MFKFKEFIKKNKWLLIVILAAAVAVGGISMIARGPAVQDGMFYQVKCQYDNEDRLYSLIVDDKPSAVAFKEDMETNDDGVKCEFISFSRATNDTLFMYAIVTVLNNVTFAFMDESTRDDTYQTQFFTATDAVAALSCRYSHARFDCYNDLPVSDCPTTQADAIKLFKGKCEYVAF